MTTIRDKFLKLLEDHGLFEDQAKGVLELYESSDMGKPMKGRMDDKVDGYPETVFVGMWMGISASAVEWIDKNMPLHWARPMFAVK